MGWGWSNIKDEWDNIRKSKVGATIIGYLTGGYTSGAVSGITAGLSAGYEANRTVAEAEKADKESRQRQAERQAAQLRVDESKIAKSAAERRGQGQVRQNAGIPMLEDNVKALTGGTLLTSTEDPVTLGKAKPLSSTTMLGG